MRDDDPLLPPPPESEQPVLAFLRAVVNGVRDTLSDALAAGRKEAAIAHDEAWDRYDQKTRYRRKKRSSESPDDSA